MAAIMTKVKDKWATHLIKDMYAWFNQKHGKVIYYVTQLPNEHGPFQSYIYCKHVMNGLCHLFSLQKVGAPWPSSLMEGCQVFSGTIIEAMMHVYGTKWHVIVNAFLRPMF